MNVDLTQATGAGIDEPVCLSRVDHRHVTRADHVLRLSVVERGRAFDHDQDLDVWVPVKTWPFSRRGVDEQHTCANSAVLFADEVSRDDVTRKFSLTKNPDRHVSRC